RPRSPETACASHSTYCTTSGRSSPIARRNRAVASGLPSGPMMMRAGSPGSTRITRKTSAETNQSVTANAARRRAAYRRTNRQLTSFRPRNLGQIGGRKREILPQSLDALLRHGETGVHEKPDRRCVFHEELLHLHVQVSASLVVQRDLRFL